MDILVENCEGIMLSVESHKSVPAPFLTKTYQLVDDPSTDHIVSWGEDHSTFVVWRPPEFARDLLPNYFKHNNFSSFVRQLNTYGFRKIVPDRWEFANEYFRKGEKQLLCEIHRRKTPHHPPQALLPFAPRLMAPPSPFMDSDDRGMWCDSTSESSSPSPPLLSNGAGTVSALSEDNERLRRSNSMLLSELAYMRKLYNDIIYFVQNHVVPVAPSNASSSRLIEPSSSLTHVNARAGFTLLGSHRCHTNNTCSTSGSSVTVVEESKPRLFGVPLQANKRPHPDPSPDDVATCASTTAPPHKWARGLVETVSVLSKEDDLALNLKPPSVSSSSPTHLKLDAPA
ncbi:hypothetical protein AMTRI_Chr04g183800 [Amborella trichopoda]|uniref:HSF-type DNA-binding domain-containing protein n=1 Tax=Amborella trichopoda TaxID=13333 RepID=W1NQR1_AMBTC|nr:heat stress transcription factor B-4 [Amborella trichopoda]ERM97305.1 hypothetical protein AMTR_s00073p00033500 [Amborella trichopoda]|eukprot:XP_006829889.1 heat stress transcription factor B-4 [Amborella trichopoda]